MTNELIPSLEPSEWWRRDPVLDLATAVLRNEADRHEASARRPPRPRRGWLPSKAGIYKSTMRLQYKSAASGVGPHSADVRGGTTRGK